ncbi:hypothetical protein ACFXKW_23715 [Streptomyces sp. NPDC059193]|uniref:hypothetical protein n=1 Tax=Streptomyces sp. NPDC059193 TaxID=3346763 RepID=UPI0036A29ED2
MTDHTNSDGPMNDQTLYRPWGTVDPAFWAGAEVTTAAATSPPPEPPADPPPQEADASVGTAVAYQLAAIQAAASSDLARANTLAEELDARTTAANGETHIDTVRVREVRAYLVHLTGHHETAVAWYLHVVRLHTRLHGPHHEETTLAVRRAYSMWRTLPDADAERLADSLIEAFTEVQGAGTTAVRRIQTWLQQQKESGEQQDEAVPAL